MSGPGDGASKQTSSVEPTLSPQAEGHGGCPDNVGLGRSLHPGSEKSSARSDRLSAREPGDLEGASPAMVAGRHRREGASYKPSRQAFEESDAGVVSKKSAKTWVTPVESMERRPAAKGKPAGRYAFRTQGRADALTKLQRVGQRAKERPQERLTNLMCHLKVPLLREAFARLKRDAAAGVDGMTWSQYEEGLEDRLRDLQDRLHRGHYHPHPVRRVHIPKGDGRTRPLGIPALEDKLVQQAVRMVLEPIYESMFLGFSYGYRPGRSQHGALNALTVALKQRVDWVLEADIQAFFDTIDHEWMRRFLEHRIGDRRLVRLLMKWLRAGVVEDEQEHEVTEGTPQGGIISPLLANIFLHYVLDLWAHAWRQKHARARVYIVRYADDFVMGFEDEGDALAMRQALEERLAKFGLRLHPDKTRVFRFGRRAMEMKRRTGLKPQSFTFLGFTHVVTTSRLGRFQVLRRTAKRKRLAKLATLRQQMRRRRHEPLALQHAWLCSVLEGHYRYYGVPLNYRAMACFRFQVESAWHRQLQRRGQKARWTSDKHHRLAQRFPLPRPRIHHPWPSLDLLRR